MRAKGITLCQAVDITPNRFGRCGLPLGHDGPHMKLHPEYGTMEFLWWDKLERCMEKHPAGRVECDLKKGHPGDHVDFDERGEERAKWKKKDDTEVSITIDAAAKGESDYSVQGEVVGEDDPNTILGWAKSQNPKTYRSSRENLSMNCTSASKALHEQCKTVWCQCACHVAELPVIDPTRCSECQHPAQVAPYHHENCTQHVKNRRPPLPWLLHVGIWLTIVRLLVA